MGSLVIDFGTVVGRLHLVIFKQWVLAIYQRYLGVRDFSIPLSFN